MSAAYPGGTGYVAYRLEGRKDEAVLVTASTAAGDALLWIVDRNFRNLAYNDNETTGTTNAKVALRLPADGRYYVVVREKRSRAARFDLTALLLNGRRGDQLTPVCPPDAEACTVDGRRPVDVCGEGSFHPPTVAVGGGTVSVGCVPRSVNNAPVRPRFIFLDDANGAVLKTETLRPLVATNARFLRQGRLYGGVQALATYDCNSGFSEATNGGAQCYEYRQYQLDGETNGAVVFGRQSLSGAPSFDWSGSKVGVSWFGFSAPTGRYELVFRTIGPTSILPTSERTLGTPLTTGASSDVDRSRTRIIWDPTSSTFAIFSNQGTGSLFFTRVKDDGSVVENPRSLGDAITMSPQAGDFDALVLGGTFYVAYERLVRERPQRVLKAITPGQAQDREVVLDEYGAEGSDPRVSLTTDGTRLFAATGFGRGAVHTINRDLTRGIQYDIDPNGGVRSPDIAWDDAAESLTLAWLDADNRSKVLVHVAPRR